MAETRTNPWEISYAFICDHAFFDKYHRLCVVGMTHRFPLPKLDVAIRNMVIVAILKNRPDGQHQVNLNLDIVTPSGLHSNPQDKSVFTIEAEGEFVLIHMRDLPIKEEGIYRFNVRVNDAAVTVEMPVLVQAGGGPVN